ncbi:MAG: hydantoinase B/oxoprolinase family protein [Alphaproteobacteria bacterium]|nr:hydantoinase B/oxoprolinase family protein [Alphaproteobacteria bacterium]
MAAVDPITFSVLWGGLLSAAAEMGVTLSRTAYSAAVREGLDYSTALFDADGNMVAQGDYSPGHLGSMAFTVRKVLETYPKEHLQPGDAILLNDSGIGSGHLPDFFMISPIHVADELIGFAVNCAHHVDVGGSGAGSQVIEGIIENYQEGIRFLPTRCYVQGAPVEDIFRVIAANVRQPEKVIGDLRAQVNANMTGARRLVSLAETHGLATLRAAMGEIIRQSEEQMRAAIRTIPDGVYSFTDHMDDVGPGTEPVVAKVTVTVADGTIAVDWTGSGPQREAGLNSYLHYTYAYTIAAVKSVTLPTAPQNEGVIRTITITAPEGTFFNPRYPAPSGGRATISHRIYETVLGALAQAVPDRVMAANSHFFNPNLGGTDPATGRAFVCYELVIGGIGGRPYKDGEEALASPWNAANIPVEIQEAANPILVERFELMADSAGPGRFRGGMGLRRDIRLLADGVRFFNLGDRSLFQPYGLAGGHGGRLAETWLNPGTAAARALHSKGSYRLAEGDLISWRTAGAGGYGDPLARDVALVVRDVVNGYVSVAAAERDYGVVLDPATLKVDVAATRRRRQAAVPQPATAD